ncbi:hypothetical protein DFS34DRAFT_364952 [Phlyctochytrium arcticum]|nr:hypothetical protein DFS34DRAFT_364952 [Phlyctochytrium arcticum]
MIFSASTGSNGALTEQLRIGSSGVFLAGNKLIASQEYVNTQIAAIPLSNYTLLSTYNTRQTAIDNRFTPIETRQGQLKGLSNKDIIDLSSGDVTGVLPVSKIDTSTLQERIGDYNKDELRQTLGIEWETLVGRPTLGGLALMNNVNLSTSDVSGNLDFARISNTPSYVLNSIYDTRITPIETKLTGYDTSITTKLLTLNLGTGNQPLGITINAPSSATSGNAILSMNNASSSTQWGLYHAGSAGTGGLGNGSLGFYSFSLSSHILQLKGDGQVAITTPTDSASSTSGALTVAGGVGVGKFLTIGGGAEATGLVETPWRPTVYQCPRLLYQYKCFCSSNNRSDRSQYRFSPSIRRCFDF